jgi:hypothetical protein
MGPVSGCGTGSQLARFGVIPGPKPNLFPEPRLKTPQPEDTSLKDPEELFLKTPRLETAQFEDLSLNTPQTQQQYKKVSRARRRSL